jgi:2-phosphoglycerate kinase
MYNRKIREILIGFARLSMKTLYLIGGTMGVGKTTVSQQLKKI